MRTSWQKYLPLGHEQGLIAVPLERVLLLRRGQQGQVSSCLVGQLGKRKLSDPCAVNRKVELRPDLTVLCDERGWLSSSSRA
jgi:hypothetical protein